jgi:hypothetical protein
MTRRPIEILIAIIVALAASPFVVSAGAQAATPV